MRKIIFILLLLCLVLAISANNKIEIEAGSKKEIKLELYNIEIDNLEFQSGTVIEICSKENIIANSNMNILEIKTNEKAVIDLKLPNLLTYKVEKDSSLIVFNNKNIEIFEHDKLVLKKSPDQFVINDYEDNSEIVIKGDKIIIKNEDTNIVIDSNTLTKYDGEEKSVEELGFWGKIFTGIGKTVYEQIEKNVKIEDIITEILNEDSK